MFESIKMWIWVKIGLKFDEPYSHHVCVSCQEIVFCPQSNIEMKLVKPCKYAEDGEHRDYEVDCNCKLSNMGLVQKIKVKMNRNESDEEW